MAKRQISFVMYRPACNTKDTACRKQFYPYIAYKYVNTIIN